MTTISGETIEIPTPDGTAEAYLTRPPETRSGDTHPGVLFIVDAIGLRPQTRKMADRIASWGYTVLVPHLFYRDGSADELAPEDDLLDAQSRDDFFAVALPRVRALTPEVVTPDLSAYVDALQKVAPGPIAVTGYCAGGRLALLAAATRPDDVAAVALFHTGGLVIDSPQSPHLWLGTVSATLLAVHADRDRSMPAEAIARFEHALIESGVTHIATVYPGAPHGYTMADTDAYNHDAAEYHYRELRKLLANTIG